MIALRTEDWIGSSKGGREVVGGWSEDGDVTGGSWMVERRTFAVDKTTEGPCFFLSASSSLFITLALTHSCMHVYFTFYFLHHLQLSVRNPLVSSLSLQQQQHS